MYHESPSEYEHERMCFGGESILIKLFGLAKMIYVIIWKNLASVLFHADLNKQKLTLSINTIFYPRTSIGYPCQVIYKCIMYCLTIAGKNVCRSRANNLDWMKSCQHLPHVFIMLMWNNLFPHFSVFHFYVLHEIDIFCDILHICIQSLLLASVNISL